MKLPDFRLHDGMNAARRMMGLAADEFGDGGFAPSDKRLTDKELEDLISPEGLEIQLDDLSVLVDSSLGYKDKRVLLYIRDVRRRRGGDFFEPRYHLANCEKLKEMKANKKFDRYVVNLGEQDRVVVNVIEGPGTTERLELRLSVCQFCLDELSFENFGDLARGKERKAFVADFSLDRFFRLYPRTLHPEEPRWTADTAPINDYAADFSERSKALRMRANWTCQNPTCQKKLEASAERRFLHVHHINGLKHDDSESNLKVLCIRCHALEPGHEHMKWLPDYRRFAAHSR